LITLRNKKPFVFITSLGPYVFVFRWETKKIAFFVFSLPPSGFYVFFVFCLFVFFL